MEWINDVFQDDSKGAEVRELMAKAFKGPLIPQQQQQVYKRRFPSHGVTRQSLRKALTTTNGNMR